jgi:two-component system nitrogen regulation response regulator NtrX
MAHDILIVDDEADIRHLVSGILEDEGYSPRAAADGNSALEAIRLRQPHLVIMDVWLNDSRYDGISLLELIQKSHPDVPVIMISGHGTIETAVAAIKKGAYDFIEKPFKSDRLLLMVERALESLHLKGENEELRKKTSVSHEFVGKSAVMTHLRQWIHKTAPTNSRILLMGNGGTAKEAVARQIHQSSHRDQGPFMILDCQNAANLEAELFGEEIQKNWEQVELKIGKLEKAHMGTLLISEVGEMSLSNQTKLLKFIQEGKFLREGGQQKVMVDVRLVVATTQDLEQLISEGKFGRDLYDRLNVTSYLIPPLRLRREDIPELVSFYLNQTARALHLKACPFSEETIMLMQAYEWPGDIHQLRNTVDWVLISAFSQGLDVITPILLPPEVRGHSATLSPTDQLNEILKFPLRESRELFERYYLTLQLNRFGGNVSQTALFVGMERSALHRKLKLLGIVSSDREGDAKLG